MKKQDVLKALKEMREKSKHRKFIQTVELIINFRGIDFRKADKRIDMEVILPHATGFQQATKVLVFAKDPNFAAQLKGKADVIMEDEIVGINKKRIAEFLAYDALLAEGPAMLTVAKYLGQQLAPKGKMPKPITANMAQFSEIVSNINVGVKITNKKGKFMPVVQVPMGKETHSDEHLAENVIAIYDALIPKLEKQKQNIKNIYLKLTMGAPVKLGDS